MHANRHQLQRSDTEKKKTLATERNPREGQKQVPPISHRGTADGLTPAFGLLKPGARPNK